MHVHATKGDAECKYWLHPDRFDIPGSSNTTAARDYGANYARLFSSISIRSAPLGGNLLESTVPAKTKPILARAIETTPHALIVIIETGPVVIPWEKCSQRLAQASPLERSRAELSPAGYGIHWPLLDEDLAIGPLLSTAI
jgi:hypothetical protein